MSSSLLNLPVEIRLTVYQLFLDDHRRARQFKQPSNAHIHILRTCRQIYAEAEGIFRRYVSLRNELEIERYIVQASWDPRLVVFADVANDGRVVGNRSTHGRDKQTLPVSQLYLVLRRLTSLKHLRVFSARNYHPYTAAGPQLRYHLDFEGSMFPCVDAFDQPPLLSAYELYLDRTTRVIPFQAINPQQVSALRLSGDCHLQTRTSFPSLRLLNLYGITSHSFDHVRFDEHFSSSYLTEFNYAQGDRLAFEMRDVHLRSLYAGPGRGLQKLVLLGANRLTSTGISDCLRSLPALRYFAISIVTVTEMRENFVAALENDVEVIKLQVTNAWYAVPLLDEERQLCHSLEERLSVPHPSPLSLLRLSCSPRVMLEGERQTRWHRLAAEGHVDLKFGPWDTEEEV